MHQQEGSMDEIGALGCLALLAFSFFILGFVTISILLMLGGWPLIVALVALATLMTVVAAFMRVFK